RHVVHLGQEVVRVDLIVQHQPGQGGAVVVQITLLHAQGLARRQARGAHHILVDALLDLRQELAFRRVEGVVEVEHPGPHVAQVGADLGARRERPARSVCRHFAFTRVPAPCSVNSSTSMACGRRPSRMTTASTPARTAAIAVSSLGIMPPVATPSSISPCASSSVIWRMISPSAPFTPGTSVSSSIRLACSAPATAPATVSALTL